MAANPSKKKTISSLYADMYNSYNDGDYSRAVKFANRIIHQSPDDRKAVHSKVVCLLNLGQFDEALRVIDGSEELFFEEVYCWYRKNELEKAWKAIENIDNLPHRLKELKAQIAYRLDDFRTTIQIYEEILAETSDDEYNEERLTNLSAAVSFLKEYEGNLGESTFEECFNKGIYLARKKKYTDAEKIIRKAEKFLQSPQVASDEVITDKANLGVLQGYCAQKQNRPKEAQNAYNNVIQMRPDNAALTVVASNNMLVLNKLDNVFDSKKKLKLFTPENLSKLPCEQRKFITLNNAIFNYHLNNSKESNRLIQYIKKEWPDVGIEIEILEKLSKARSTEHDPVEALKEIKTKNIQENVILKLSMAQLLLEKGNKKEACNVLSMLDEENVNRPGIVGALVTLHMSMGNQDLASKIFETAIEWYKSKKDSDPNYSSKKLIKFYTQAAEFHIRNGNSQVAAESLQRILDSNKSDKKSMAQLLLAFAGFNHDSAISCGKQLGDFSKLYEDVDVQNIESNAWLSRKHAEIINQLKESPSVTNDVIKKKKQKKKKPGPLPKNYDASATPDPERWLPKHERSTFRKKKDRRFKEVIKGSQGASSAAVTEQYDYTKMVAAEADEATQGPSHEPSPAQRGSNRPKKGAGHKKKSSKRR